MNKLRIGILGASRGFDFADYDDFLNSGIDGVIIANYAHQQKRNTGSGRKHLQSRTAALRFCAFETRWKLSFSY